MRRGLHVLGTVRVRFILNHLRKHLLGHLILVFRQSITEYYTVEVTLYMLINDEG